MTIMILIILGIIIFAYPVTRLISSAWHRQKFKELDNKIKKENLNG